MKRRRDLVLAAAAIGVGIAVLVYRGPGRPFIRGHVGDVAATMLVFALFGLTSWRPRTRAIATMGVATAIELGQLVWTGLGKTAAGTLVLGSYFDPWDLAAYLVGVIVSLAYIRGHDDLRRPVPSQ